MIRPTPAIAMLAPYSRTSVVVRPGILPRGRVVGRALAM